MTKQKRLEIMTRAATLLIIVAPIVLLFLASRVENFETISSREVDEILYKRLDEYERTYKEIPGLARIFVTAMTNPDELVVADRQIYLEYERKFFDGWEAAWKYNDAGYFDDRRYSDWESWYINEVRRRPTFAWTENRKHYSGAFLHHVDDSVQAQ